MSWYLPGLHLVHDDSLVPEYEPVPHLPVTAEGEHKKPAGHSVHVAQPSAE